MLRHDPLGGHVFIFLNRRKTQVKLLAWTRGGYTIVHKRLERGSFAFPKYMTSFTSSETTKKAQNKRFGALGADKSQGMVDLIHLKTPRGFFIGRQTWVRDVKRRLQRGLGFSSAEKERSLAGSDPHDPSRK